MKTLFLSMMIYSALSAPAEAFNPVKFVKTAAKVAIRLPGSLVKTTIDVVPQGAGLLMLRLAGARDGQG